MDGSIRRRLLLAIMSLLLVAKDATAFNLYTLNGTERGPTLLLLAGIQGDEPGGFLAADLLLHHYTITRGHLWLVPNLNYASIIARRRGLHGDLNHKFAALSEDDPDYRLVQRIKRLIRSPQVSGVLNLHDGSGFYRSRYLDPRHNPERWGQATVIDQALLPGVPYGALAEIAGRVRDAVNHHLLRPGDRFSLKNTRTRTSDAVMAKTLSYYAVRQGKPAFAIEASTAFGIERRIYYHLRAVEAYLTAFGIGFQRQLELTPEGISAALDAEPQIALDDRRQVFDLADARPRIDYVPMRKGSKKVTYQASSPLVALVASDKGYLVRYGNNGQTLLQPNYLDFDDSLDHLRLVQHGREAVIAFGTIVSVSGRVALKVPAGYRVNLIGFRRAGRYNEAGITVSRKDFIEHFSVDQAGLRYRAEVYRGRRFCGMVLLDFSGHSRGKGTVWRYSGRALKAGAVPRSAHRAGSAMSGR